MSASLTRQENVNFLYYAIKRVWMAAGATEEHAHYVADGISFAHIQGKLNQGLGVYEGLDIPLQSGMLDINATPEIVDQETSPYSVRDIITRSAEVIANLL